MTEPIDPARDPEPRRPVENLDEPMTDYPRAPEPTQEQAPQGQGTAKFFGMELAVFPTVALLIVVFAAVIIYFAVIR